MIKIYSIHFNRPDFVHLQAKTLKRFLKDDYELIIVNNSNDQNIFERISKSCSDERLREFVVSSNISRQAAQAYPGYHHSIAMNDVLEKEISKQEDICVILDGDVFLMGEYSFSERMKDCQMLGALQHRKGRYWLTPVVIAMKPHLLRDFDDVNLIGSHIYNTSPDDIMKDSSHYPRLINGSYMFDCPVCNGLVNNDPEFHIPLDTGGNLYMYLKSHPEVKVKKAFSSSHLKSSNSHVLPEKFRERYTEDFAFEFYDSKFLHYCRSSNWDHKTDAYHTNKTRLLIDMIDFSQREAEIDVKYQIPDNEWSGWPESALVRHRVD